MKSRIIVLFFAVGLLMSACSNSHHEDTTPSGTTPSDAVISNTVSSGDTTEASKPTESFEPETTSPSVDDAILNDLTERFSKWASPYNMALICEFSSPAELPLGSYLCAGPSANLTDEEWAQLPAYNPMLDACRFPAEQIDNILIQYFGITVDDLNEECLNGLDYLESTDCYYLQTGVNYFDGFTLISSETLEDGNIRLYYSGTGYGQHIITLKPVDDRYIMVSNLPA